MLSSSLHRFGHLFAAVALILTVTSTSAIGATAQGGGGGGGGPDERGPDAAEGRYEVAVDCTYNADADRTTCTFQGVAGPGAKDVSHVDVPEAVVCAEVVGGDYEYVSPDPNTGVTGFKSKGSRGTLTLVLAGQVVVDGTATYAIKSGDGVFRVEGQGLECDSTDAAGDVETERSTVRLVTFHCPTEGKSRTTFEALNDLSDDDTDVALDLDDIDVDALDDATCVRAAAVGFVVTDADGEVVVQAATDGLGEAEIALVPATYILNENVLEASTELTVTEDGPLTVAVVILGAVPLEGDTETQADAPVVDVAPDAEEPVPAEDAETSEDLEAEDADDSVETEAEEQQPAENGEADAPDDEADAPDTEAEAQTAGEDANENVETEVEEDSGTGAESGDVTDSNGAIVVRKHVCEIAEPGPEVDWGAVCALSSNGATFRLTPVEETATLPPSVGTTAGGVLNFDQLPSGRYQLEEVDSRWCHAQSDSVNAEGQVIVEAGQRATVWIYNCTEAA